MRYLLLLSLLLLPLAHGATLHGNVYDISFEPLANVVVKVNSTPAQTMVAKDGSYSFTLTPGEYEVTASVADTQELQLYASEKISITEDGDFVLDMFTFPELEDEVAELDLGLEEAALDDIEKKPNYSWVFLLMMLAGIVMWRFGVQGEEGKKNKKGTDPGVKKEAGKKPQETASEKELEEDLQEVLSILKAEGGRISQKDLRKKIPLSEAKISLMITDLESRGRVKKIKKGRGNILILQ